MTRLAPVLLLLLAVAFPARAEDPVPDARMDEYIVARASDHRVVRTFGVSTCVVLTLYDPAAQVGALAHVSAMADIPRSLAAVFADLRAAGAGNGALRAQLFGGWRTDPNGMTLFRSTSPEMVKEIKAVLAKRSVPVAREETLTDPEHPGTVKPIRNFAFDLLTGTVTDIEAGPGVMPAPGSDPEAQARFAQTHLLQRNPASLGAP